MKLVYKDKPLRDGTPSAKAKLTYLEFVDHTGTLRCIPAPTDKREARAMLDAVEWALLTKDKGEAPPEKFWRIMGGLPAAYTESLVAIGLIPAEQARIGRRLFDHATAYGEALMAVGNSRPAVRATVAQLLQLFAWMHWYVMADASVEALREWFLGLSVYNPNHRWYKFPRADGEEKLYAFIAFARWVGEERGASRELVEGAGALLVAPPVLPRAREARYPL